MGTWIAPEATSGTVSRNAAGIFGSTSGWFMKKPLTMTRFTIRSNGLIVTSQPSAHVGIDDEDPVRAEHAGDHRAALARNAVDSELHAAVGDRCPDLVERAVFVHNHEIAADGLQLRDEFRATHEIDCLNTARLVEREMRPESRIGHSC